MPDLPTGTVTFLFTDIEGSTALWERDRRAMREAVHQHLAVLRDTIAANRGVLFKTVGDAVQAAFETAPQALIAAVDAQRALQQESWPDAVGPLRVRMALHAGMAEPIDSDYLAPSLNRLSRLLASGHGGQVLVTETVRRLLEGEGPAGATLRRLGSHRLRDLLEPEEIYQVLAPGLAEQFPPLRALPSHPNMPPASPSVPVPKALLEREGHLTALDRWLDDAATGLGRFALVGGEAGVGKSVLVERFCQTVATRKQDRILRGACDALSTPRPLGPLQDIAAQTGGTLDRLLTDDAPRDQLFRAFLAELSGSLTPTLAVIEDAHWADEATLDLLRFLGRRLDTVRALLIVTYRTDEVGPKHPFRRVLGDLATTSTLRRLDLTPLSEDSIRALAEGSGWDPSALYLLTGGNPFFASEVLAADAAAGETPATIRDAVLVRASRLPATGQEVLEVASVIGSPLRGDLLSTVTEAPANAIDDCLASGMLVTVDTRTYAFRHELARAAILDAIPPSRLRELHGRVLAALQLAPVTEQDLARLAHHAEGADDREAVLRFAPAAGRQAAMLRAHRQAADQFARALRFAQERPPSERAVLLESYSYECYLTSRLTEAVESRREAIQLRRATGDRLREGDGQRWMSRFAWLAGRTDEAITAAGEALTILEALPPGRELAMALSNAAQLHMLAGEIDAAVAQGERAITLAETLDETEILVHALNNVGTARLNAADERGREELERSLALARDAGLEDHIGRALTNLSTSAVYTRDLSRAEAYLAAGLAYATDHDLDLYRTYLLGWCAYLHLLRSQWAAASDDAEAVLGVPNVTPVNRIAALTTRGLVRARKGESGAAEALDEALALAERTGEMQRLGPVRMARTEVAWLADDRERAAAEVRAILPLALQRGSPWQIGEVLVWCQRLGLPGELDQALDRATLAAPYRLALAGNWTDAAAAWEALGCAYDAALALLDGDEGAVRKARTMFERLGAPSAVARATRRLCELGVEESSDPV